MRPSAGAQMESIQGPHPQRALSSVRGGPRNFPPQGSQTQMSSWSTRKKHQIRLQLGYHMNFISKVLVAEKCGSADTTKENWPETALPYTHIILTDQNDYL